MRINLMTDYAVRIVCCMHECEEGVITSSQISKKEGISHGILMKVLKQLREEGIVISYRGRGQVVGGYKLRRTVKEITLLDIIEMMEGTLKLENIRSRGEGTTIYIGDDMILAEYRRLSEVFRNEMKKNTLYEILKRGKITE
jgi:Predicted transcriptional regulator